MHKIKKEYLSGYSFFVRNKKIFSLDNYTHIGYNIIVILYPIWVYIKRRFLWQIVQTLNVNAKTVHAVIIAGATAKLVLVRIALTKKNNFML